jgi:hypothetical protein
LSGLPYNASDFYYGNRFSQTWDPGALQKHSSHWAYCVTSEKDHALEKLWVVMFQLVVEPWPIELGHTEITENEIKRLFLKLCQRQAPVGGCLGGCLDCVPIMA